MYSFPSCKLPTIVTGAFCDMKKILCFIVFCLTSNVWGETSATVEPPTKLKTCANVTRITVAVNLLDKECMKTSSSSAILLNGDENNVEVKDIEMNVYALCLLQKSSIMNEQGKINLNFDIFKIVKNLYKRTDQRGFGLAFIIKSLEKCRQTDGPDQFSTATKIMKCLLDNQKTVIRCDQH